MSDQVGIGVSQVRPSVALKSGRALIRSLTETHNARNPRVFGSALHGTDTAKSDLDILVETTSSTTLFDLGALQEELQTALGVQVDIRTPFDLPERFRSEVLAHAQPV